MGSGKTADFWESKNWIVQGYTDESSAILDFSNPFTLHVDSSNHIIGSYLTQPDANQKERPVSFISKKGAL